jgi:hypothetical protein
MTMARQRSGMASVSSWTSITDNGGILCFSDLGKLRRVTGFLARSRSWTTALKIERSVCTASRTMPGERDRGPGTCHACDSGDVMPAILVGGSKLLRARPIGRKTAP